jgi:membrane protein required for colicin V production
MTWIDVAVVAVILLSAVVGLARGLIREVLSLAAWLAALGLGYLYYKPFAETLVPYIAHPGVRLGTAFVLLVLGVLVLGAVLGALLSALIDKTGLTWLDRLFGLFFGAARGGVVVAMVVFLAALTPLADETWWKDSATISYWQKTADWLIGLVPPGIQDQLKKV